MSDQEPSVTRSSLLMASGTLVSRILGFARAVLLAAAIGVTTDAADAFGVANQLPNNVYAIIVGGVLNAVLVPQLVRARGGLDGGKGYIDRFVTLAITVFFSMTLLFTLLAPVLVRIYTSGWSEDQLALATAFAYWCVPQLFFYGLYSVFGEVLNSRKAFGPFMWAPVLNNVVSLAGLLAFILIFGADPTGARAISDWGADRIILLAGSATLGVAAQALILLVSWRKIGIRLSLNFKWRGFGLGPALKAASWSLAMVLVTQIGGLVQTAVASTAAAERGSSGAVASVAAVAIAWLIFMLPHSVVTVSVATAYFTRMAEHQQSGQMEKFKTDLTTGLRVIALVSVISTAVLIVLSYPIARVFAGEYPATSALGNVIAAFMIGLLPFSFVYMM
ncbi:MAG: lipid II flippase MurJ, partial [Aquiluna sp.]